MNKEYYFILHPIKSLNEWEEVAQRYARIFIFTKKINI